MIQMKFKKMYFLFVTAVLAAFLAACSSSDQTTQPTHHKEAEKMKHMNHSNSDELPKGLKKAANPTYKLGNTAMMNTDHMEGMNGAEATIAGVFDTTVYMISYIPTTGGKNVTNHKWIIHEEIKNERDELYQAGENVTVEADHLEGMENAEATIDSAHETTVYMVDYTSTKDGEQVKNHKWVIESELTEK